MEAVKTVGLAALTVFAAAIAWKTGEYVADIATDWFDDILGEDVDI